MSVKHSPRFIKDPSEHLTWLPGLNYQIHPVDNSPWRQKAKFPAIGLNFIYANFGNPEVFGHALGFYPNVEFKFPAERKLNGYFSIGFGLAWLNKTYDPESNGSNNAIGSHLNGVAAAKLGLA